ncbi:MAG: UDP-N-acetylmuramoyl-tripeptide--D-alanyl-D-alanine ligase, partial [Gammaproteobacteria bacterium]|nr:UDP-N-acetylmuramoyl-tripeptide--D-alanyl-D-alanine ligase [Gammaproteobacteria bacterium]
MATAIPLRSGEAFSTTMAELQRWLGVDSRTDGDAVVSGLTSDSRLLRSGDCFVALNGEQFDGHHYLGAAQAAGAVVAVVERIDSSLSLPQLLVEDSRVALGAIASGWRNRSDATVVAITGSNGKTTVKEMVAAILRRVGETVATTGNLNNDIGVPYTLLQLTPSTRYAVVEMGANRPGDIEPLTRMARPAVALVNGVAPAHLEGFGSLACIAMTKGEIFNGLEPGGTAIFVDDPTFFSLWQEMAADYPQIIFGLGEQADYRALYQSSQSGVTVDVITATERETIRSPLLGDHNVHNLLAAVAIARTLEISWDEIRSGLAAMAVVPGRLQLRHAREDLGEIAVLDDSYNANPASLEAGLKVLQS